MRILTPAMMRVFPPSDSGIKRPFSGMLLALVYLFLSPSVSGQADSMEDDLFECLRGSFTERSGILDSLMTTFESELIVEGLMDNSSPEEYRGFLQRIASEQPVLRGMDAYFFTRFRNLGPDTLAILHCVETMERFSAQNPGDRLGQTLSLRQELIDENTAPAQQASALLDILETSDFEKPIYRLLTYHIIDGQAYVTASSSPVAGGLIGLGSLNDNGANLFQVLMNEAGQLIVSDQLVTPEELLLQVQRHAREFEQQAVYLVEVEDDVKYGAFIRLKDQIALAVTRVRDDYARRYLGKTLTELTPEERLAVFEKYPLQLISP